MFPCQSWFPKQFVCSGAYPPYPEESKVHIIVHLIGFQDNKLLFKHK